MGRFSFDSDVLLEFSDNPGPHASKKEYTMTYSPFIHSGFLGGMARGLDSGETLAEFNRSITAEEADMENAKSDWIAVGKDIFAALVGNDAKTKTK